MNHDPATLGFIGLGQMGSRMARNLLEAGYHVLGHDLNPAALTTLAEQGGEPADSAEQVVQRCDTVLTCLVSEPLLTLARQTLLPHARTGQIFVDHSTLPAPEARRLAADFAERGATYLDVPISGGTDGARDGRLRMFAGGEEATFQRILPILHVLGDPEEIHYAGPVGQGQVMKVVQQLQHRIIDAVSMEVMAFGVRAGLTLEQVGRVLQVQPDGPDPYSGIYRKVQSGETDTGMACLFGEWPYYLAEAREKQIPMPALEAMYRFYKRGDMTDTDGQGRPGPSLWNELTRRTGPALDE